MPVALSKMYKTLTEQQQKEVYDFVFSFYKQNEKLQEKPEPCGFGSLKEYANPNLRKKEKDAWALAAEEKHGIFGR